MNPLSLAEVLLDGEEERLVRGELGQLPLRGVAAAGVRCDLGEEVRQAAPPLQRGPRCVLGEEVRQASRLLQRGNPEEDLAAIVVLRDRLEGLDVLKPQPVHRLFNDRTYSADTAPPRGWGPGG